MLSFVATPDNPKPTELISLKEVMRRIQRSRSTIYRWIHQGILPKQAKKEDGTTSALWFADEVDASIARLRNPHSGLPAPPPSGARNLWNRNSQQTAAKMRLTSQSPKLGGKQHKRMSSKRLRPVKNESGACFVVGPVLIGTHEAFFDPQSGRIFAVIGYLPLLEAKTASNSVQKHWQADEAGGGQ